MSYEKNCSSYNSFIKCSFNKIDVNFLAILIQWLHLLTYCTVKTLAVKNLWWIYTVIHQVFGQFYYFHNIPYANGLQFTKVLSAKLPAVLIRQTFLPLKFFTIWHLNCIYMYIQSICTNYKLTIYSILLVTVKGN